MLKICNISPMLFKEKQDNFKKSAGIFSIIKKEDALTFQTSSFSNNHNSLFN